jgi:hypothetical protein
MCYARMRREAALQIAKGRGGALLIVERGGEAYRLHRAEGGCRGGSTDIAGREAEQERTFEGGREEGGREERRGEGG